MYVDQTGNRRRSIRDKTVYVTLFTERLTLTLLGKGVTR